MKGLSLYLLLLAMVVLFHDTQGLKCLKYFGVWGYNASTQVVECGPGEGCYLHQDTAIGGIYETYGCRLMKGCPDFEYARDHHVRSDASPERRGWPYPISICTKCCNDSDLCHLAMCPQKRPPSVRAPICYNCQHPHSGTCTTVKSCNADEICSFSRATDPDGRDYLSTRCLPVSNCQTSSTAVGKRSPGSTQHCSNCCHGDLCNASGCGL